MSTDFYVEQVVYPRYIRICHDRFELDIRYDGCTFDSPLEWDSLFSIHYGIIERWACYYAGSDSNKYKYYSEWVNQFIKYDESIPGSEIEGYTISGLFIPLVVSEYNGCVSRVSMGSFDWDSVVDINNLTSIAPDSSWGVMDGESWYGRSGPAGYAYCDIDSIKSRMGDPVQLPDNKSLSVFLRDSLGGLLGTYSLYLSGEVYGYSFTDYMSGESDSCSGFYGSDFDSNGMLDSLPSEYRADILLAISEGV